MGPNQNTERHRNDFSRFSPVARAISMLLALLAGSLHIANLWQAPLTESLLLEAGRGVVLLLLALGLMGTAMLSLFLVVLFCGFSLFATGSPTAIGALVSGVEVALILFTMIAILLTRREN